MTREHIAVIGAGVAGLTAAHLLSRCHDVVVYEAGTKPGGHADTRTIRTPDSAFVQVDTGFIVHNGPNYPCLTRLFEELGVRTRTSDMSMSVSCRECGLEYAGGKRGAGLVTPGAMRAGRRYLGMLAELPRFNRTARRLLVAATPVRVSASSWCGAGSPATSSTTTRCLWCPRSGRRARR